MKRVCKRCSYEGTLSDKVMEFSHLMNEWLCEDCHGLARDIFVDWREKFLVKKNIALDIENA